MNEPRAFLDAVERNDAARVAGALAAEPALARRAFGYDKTALHLAAEKDAGDSARLLLDAGAELEARTSWGDTPLTWAATMGSSRVAELLLARGARGLTLIPAAALGRLDQVRAILESGADLSAHQSPVHQSGPDTEWPADSAHMRGDVISEALHAAARNGHTAVVEYLLARGGDLDAKGFFGATGLHWAAINGHEAMVDLLVRLGADRTIRDARFGSTPDAWAEEGGHTALASRLRQE